MEPTGLTAELIAAAASYCEKRGISKARLATIVAKDGKFFNRIEGGGGLTVEMYERFMRYFADNPPAQETSAPPDIKPPPAEAAE